jgi:hypothetical protein
MASTSQSTSTNEFYYSCRNGLIDHVREKLPKMSLEEIDQVQANGSTALHAACFYSQTEIVKLLLAKGASRSIRNSHNSLPYDEIETEEIKKLFMRQSTTRFANDGSVYMDWMKCDATTEQLANGYRVRQSGLEGKSKTTEQRIKCIKDQLSPTKKDRTRTFLTQAQTDPCCLLRAYTVESDFYVKLNKDLSTQRFEQGTNFGITYFIDFFYNNPAFENLSFKGKIYRVMSISHDDLKQYSVGGKVRNKVFMSTTKDRKIAEELATKAANNSHKPVKVSALCTYEIINNRTALDIEQISEYRHEREVLIGPYTAFKITTIRQIAPNYIEIDLRECATGNEEENDENDDWD